MKSLLVVPAIIFFFIQFNSEIVAQNNSKDQSMIIIEKVEGSVSETVDKLIESTPGYGKDSSPLYVVDYKLVNRQAIMNITNDQVIAIAIIKKEYIEEIHGKGAVESGVIKIMTNVGQRKTLKGVKLPE